MAVFASTRHPGCTCPDGFSGPHCEFLGQESASSSSPSDPDHVSVEEKRNGLKATLAVILILLVTLVAGSLSQKYLSRSQIETDTAKEHPSSPSLTQNISPAGSAEYMEELADMQCLPLDSEKELQRVDHLTETSC